MVIDYGLACQVFSPQHLSSCSSIGILIASVEQQRFCALFSHLTLPILDIQNSEHHSVYCHKHLHPPKHGRYTYNQHASSSTTPIFARMRPIPFFTVFYSTTFSITILLLTAFLLITPADHVYQSLHNEQLYYAFFIAGAYLVTLITAAFIWAGRLYKSRSTLAAVPRSWNSLEKGDAPRRVGRLVREGLERSARIAWEGRPRERKKEGENGTGAAVPHWGIISHPGWSSPESKDLPNLHLQPIITELPHLIEAKAVALAPTTSQCSTSGLSLENTSDEEVVAASPSAMALLQRPAAMSLRDYLTHLSSISLINPPDLAPTFLSMYESARFSGSAITENEFRTLMFTFADLLRGMQSLDAEVIDELRDIEEDENVNWDGMQLGSDGTQDQYDRPRSSLETTSTVAHTPMPHPYTPSLSSAGGSKHSLRTAPSARRSQQEARSPRGSIVRHRGLRTPSISTLRSLKSRASSVLTGGSVGGGSVIHMAEAAGELDLPRVDHGRG